MLSDLSEKLFIFSTAAEVLYIERYGELWMSHNDGWKIVIITQQIYIFIDTTFY